MKRDEDPTTSRPTKPGDASDDGASSSGHFAQMAMYPYESLYAAWDHLYSTVAREVLDAPNELRWDLEPRDTWLSPQLALGMACGWPLVTQLMHRVRVVGTFLYGIEGAVSETYRSVVVARESSTIASLADATLAYNSTDSLSGYVSIISLLPMARPRWSGRTLVTGDHLTSIDAVREGRADVASIDALTWAYAARDAPHLMHDLVIIDRGPVVPHLPLITRLDATDGALADWRTAFAGAIENPALATTLDTLQIRGFVGLDFKDYETALGPLHRIGM